MAQPHLKQSEANFPYQPKTEPSPLPCPLLQHPICTIKPRAECQTNSGAAIRIEPISDIRGKPAVAWQYDESHSAASNTLLGFTPTPPLPRTASPCKSGRAPS